MRERFGTHSCFATAFWCALLLAAIDLAAARRAAVAEGIDAETLQARLDEILDDHPTAKRTTVTLRVLDLESGETLYDRGGDKLQVPASNLKIYTSACALDAFAPEHRFETQLCVEGNIGDGVLRGTLRLVGGGDSMLSSRDLRRLAKRVRSEFGVKRIAGRVVVDNSRYAPQRLGPGWMWDDEAEYYNMSVTPLMVDFNVATVRLQPEAGGVTAELVPPSLSPRLVRVGEEAAAGRRGAFRVPFESDIQYVGDQQVKEKRDIRIAVHDPAEWVQGMFTAMLAEEGIAVEESSSPAETQREGVIRTLVHRGPTLAETLKHFNHVSENAVGEVLLHEIALKHGVERPDWPDGAKIVTEWLIESAQLEPGSFRYVDGSGLSRYNLISADSSIRLLAHMQRSGHFEPFFQSLPTTEVERAEVAGKKGDDGKHEPAVSAKGGSMSSVSTMSGYVRTDDGRLLAFSLLANGFIGTNEPVLALRQEVWRELVRYRP
jgi:serine-type D-Ala-D-Ala carboxypeptidase/endopeptidase (penicillin-binding protein 4)